MHPCFWFTHHTGFEMHLVVEVAALLLWFPKWVLAGLVVCRSRAFALLYAIAPPNADCIGGLCRLLLLQVVFTSRPLPLGGNDVADTLEPPNTTPGRLADLDLLEVDSLMKRRTRLFVF